MQAMCFKGHGGLLQHASVQSSTVQIAPWWSTVFGSPRIFGELCGQLKPSSDDQPNGKDKTTATQVKYATHHGTIMAFQEKGSSDTSKFSLVSGQSEDSRKENKAQQLSTTISLQPSPPEHQAHFGLGFGQHMVFADHAYMDHCYGLYPGCGAQAKHGQVLLPLNVAEDGATYVNAKQYHGILRRRKSRAKAEMKNKLIKFRKPYLHESRHLHAMRRPRGCGGRFLNTKNGNIGKGGSTVDKESGKGAQAASSSSSEILQSDSGNSNSGKVTCGGPSLSGSEVTSIYPQADTDCFRIENLRSSGFHHFTNMTPVGLSSSSTIKWATSDGCSNLFRG